MWGCVSCKVTPEQRSDGREGARHWATTWRKSIPGREGRTAEDPELGV